MRVTLVCVGRLRRDFQPLFRRYLDLLKPYLEVEVVEVGEVPLSQGREMVLRREAEGILRRLRAASYKVVLDRRGRELSSEELSRWLADLKVRGRGDFQFILGGALGLDVSVWEAGDFHWSLSRLTFPHQLARCLVLEQLYRAMRIERGEPYHY